MKNLLKKTSLMPILCAITLSSCGGNSLPQKGFDKYKKQVSEYYKYLGGTGDEFAYHSCKYVWITGDGSLSADSLKDTIWYSVSYTFTVAGKSTNGNYYLIYYGDSDYVTDSGTYTAYSYAYSLVSAGSLKGEIGFLNTDTIRIMI